MDQYKGMTSTGNGRRVGKYKNLFLFFRLSQVDSMAQHTPPIPMSLVPGAHAVGGREPTLASRPLTHMHKHTHTHARTHARMHTHTVL